MELTGSAALVTGGGGGLGTIICLELAKAGASVAVAYARNRERAERVCAMIDGIDGIGGRAIPIALDQTDEKAVRQGVGDAAEALGGIDLLVNNAGMASGGHAVPPGDLDAFTPDIWDEMMAVNLRGPFLVTRAAAPLLRRSRWGRVVNIGSTIGHGTWGASAAYAPSKAAIASLTRFCAAALAPDVTVNCVAPGLMEDTQMSGGAPESFIDSWRDAALLRATTSKEDVARQVVAFCRADTVTGQVLVMDGGIHFG